MSLPRAFVGGRAAAIRAVLWAAAILALPSAAAGQTAPQTPPVQDWSNGVETVTVTGTKTAGPALWHISANGSEIWILGSVTPLPKDLEWNSDEIKTVLDGAKEVYLEPGLKAGFFEISWFLLTGLGSLKQPDGQTLEGSLPQALRDRFVVARTALKKDAGTYSDYLPAVAALDMEYDFRSLMGLTGTSAGDQVKKLARKYKVPAKPVAAYKAMPVIEEVPQLSATAQQACLSDALDDIEVQTAHAGAAARAWAAGDLEGVKANYSESKLFSCFDQTKTFAAYREELISDYFDAVQNALAKPGKTLVVIGMGPLLRKNGLLERLEQSGIAVASPAD